MQLLYSKGGPGYRSSLLIHRTQSFQIFFENHLNNIPYSFTLSRFFFASFGSILYCTNMACQGPGYQPPIIGFQSTVIFSFDISPKRVFRRTCNIPQLKHSSTKRIKVVPGPKAKSLCKARIHQWGIQFGTQKTAHTF